MNDQQLIDLLHSESVNERSAALELLSASYSNAPAMLGAILEGWDRFGVAEAYPEFAQLSHLPVHHQYVEELVQRASRMASGRKLVDPVCRFAGKIVEALVLLPAEQLSDVVPMLEELKKSSKIFFRIDLAEMRRRIELAEMSDEGLLELLEPNWSNSGDPRTYVDAIYSLETLYHRGAGEEVIRVWLSPSDTWGQDQPRRLPIALQVASRHAFLGFEDALVVHINHVEATIAATACIALARCRSRDAVYAIVEKFTSESATTQLRMADVLGRLRLPGASVRIHELREASGDPKVCDALNLAEVLHFDYTQIDNWMEALFVLNDETLRRYRSLIELALPLANMQPESIRRHVEEALRIRRKS